MTNRLSDDQKWLLDLVVGKLRDFDEVLVAWSDYGDIHMVDDDLSRADHLISVSDTDEYISQINTRKVAHILGGSENISKDMAEYLKLCNLKDMSELEAVDYFYDEYEDDIDRAIADLQYILDKACNVNGYDIYDRVYANVRECI